MSDTLESSPAGSIEKLLALAAVSAEWRESPAGQSKENER
jgi:hypothetical protein